MFPKSMPPHRRIVEDIVKQIRQRGHHDAPKPPCSGSHCKKSSSTIPSQPTPTTQPPVPAPPPDPMTSISTTSAVPNSPTTPFSATITEGPAMNSPPPIITIPSTQVDPPANSDAASSTVDNPDPGNGTGSIDSGSEGSVLPSTTVFPSSTVLPSSTTNQFGVPFGSDPIHGMATRGSGAYNTDSSVPAPSSTASKGPDVGAIVGGTLGTISFVLILLFLVLWLIRRRKTGRMAPSSEFLTSPRRPFTGSPPYRRIETQSVTRSLRGSLANVRTPRS